MKTLKQLLIENDHYINGGGTGTDKEWGHAYCTFFYDEHFASYRDKKITLVEIGTRTGSSLLLWRDYFSDVTIYGLDNDAGRMLSEITTIPNITPLIGDAYTTEMADQIPEVDIAIDDGPHQPDSWVKFIDLYLPKVKPGGILVIEDINDFGFSEVLASKVQGYKYQVFDLRGKEYDNTQGNPNAHTPSDTVMFVVWK
jgi:hypothetical protein